MEKNNYSNEQSKMDHNDGKHFDIDKQHMEETRHEGSFYQFLYNLREENPWDERDFNSIFMYL